MRRSPLSRTPDKSRVSSRSRVFDMNTTQRTASTLYYCHYKNAMYMGGIKSFKKDGKGIILHDSGLSVLTSYHNDLMHGHNIFLDNHTLLSAFFNKNKVLEAVYRTEGFLVYLNYNQHKELDGVVKLLNFVSKTIIYATFKRGNMLDKAEQTDEKVLNKVFQSAELELLIGRTHAKVMKYQFQKIPSIQFQKQGNKIVVGFQKNGFINGLGLQFVFRGAQGGYNPDTHRNQDQFQLRIMERGYYMNTQLNGMGEKVFKNGNFYLGQFKNGIFEGNGILKNNQKKNWVSGFFQDGNLVQLFQYSSDGTNRNIDRIVEALHERKTNWINNQIHLLNLNMFIDQIEKIITTAPNKQVQTLEQRKLEVLKRIQDKFIQENDDIPTEELESSINQLRSGKMQQSFGVQNQIVKPIEGRYYAQSKGSSAINEFNSSERAQKAEKSSNSVTPTKRSNLNQTQGKPSQHHQYPEWIRVSDHLFSSRKTEQPSVGEMNKWRDNRGQKQKSREMGSSEMPQSSDRLSLNNSKSPLDSKRMVSKNRIFKYLQSQQSRRSPQFSYSKTDTLREMDRQR